MQCERKLYIAGIPVRFPHVPYRAQIALMHAVISAAKTKRHALVESPTGTGKSLALLCSSLAFQEASELGAENTTQPVTQRPSQNPAGPVSVPAESLQKQEKAKKVEAAFEDSDSDFAEPKKFRDVSWQRTISKEKAERREEEPANAFMFRRLFSVERDRPLDAEELPLGTPMDATDASQRAGKQVPRIFYATRTHKQVAHVVGELRKTEYRPRICVLASRKEYCIREQVRESSQRDEICKGMVKEGQCQYYYQAEQLADHEELQGEAWDIEELTELGKNHGACPYYASHELYQKAQLILCPYSYLVDPIVRGARGINLSGDIVILDEAHNIETYARDSAGFEADVADMRRCCDEVDTMILTDSFGGTSSDLAVAYRMLKGPFESFMTLVDNLVASDELKRTENCEMAIFEREDLTHRLAAVDINEKELKRWRATYEFIANYGDGNESKRKKSMGSIQNDPNGNQERGELKQSELQSTQVQKSDSSGYGYGGSTNDATGRAYDKNEEPEQPRVANGRGKSSRRVGRRGRRRRGMDYSSGEQKPWVAKCMAMTHALLTTLEYLFENRNDFTLVVERKTMNYVTTIKVNLMCLNAAVCFREISTKARSVIVTSGTLTPIESFAGELGTNFAITKSLPHIIDVQKQLFVGTASRGPGGEMFDATFTGSSRFSFQDSLGQALVDYCKIIPGGVLVFFPSYRLMDQLSERWKGSGTWDKLCETKPCVLKEPTSRGEDFDQMVKQYEQASSLPSGAILFGVCRGKLSEGVDFKDDTSRAVIIIGIPFPHKTDISVTHKRNWNDRERKHDANKKLQSGCEWYETQAFRALNQALGRTIRHRYDYGAILLVDYRYTQQRTHQQLPKWTRQGIHRSDGKHESLLHSLANFYESVQQRIATSVLT